MKTTNRIRNTISVAMLGGIGLLNSTHVFGQVITLDQPVSNSVASITGIYYPFTSVTATTTPDASGHGYTGNLAADNGTTPFQTTGVNAPGTSGYGSGIRFSTSATSPGSLGNPRVFANLPTVNNLGMAATSFTGGAWLQFNSILSGVTQTVMIMDRGGYNSHNGTNGGHYSLFLTKDASDNWKIGFDVGDGTNSVSVFSNLTSQNWDLQNGNWHNIGFSFLYGGGTSSNTINFWLDGINVGSATESIQITSGASDAVTRRFSIGERAASSYVSVFNGSMDDVFVTNGVYTFSPAVPEPNAASLSLIGCALFGMLRLKTIYAKKNTRQ